MDPTARFAIFKYSVRVRRTSDVNIPYNHYAGKRKSLIPLHTLYHHSISLAGSHLFQLSFCVTAEF